MNSNKNNFIVVFPLQNRNKNIFLNLPVPSKSIYDNIVVVAAKKRSPDEACCLTNFKFIAFIAAIILFYENQKKSVCGFERIWKIKVFISGTVSESYVRFQHFIASHILFRFVYNRFCMTPFVTEEKGNFNSIIHPFIII